MNETTVLAEHAANLTYEDLPQEVVEKAKLLILDNLGCQIAFATLPWGKAAYRYTLGKRSVGQSTLSYYGNKIAAEDAAFCNAIFAHGFEMDDTEMKTTSHPGASVIPVVLALGESECKSGKDVLTAMVAGYETFLRFAYAADSMRNNWFHASSVSGAFGAAAAAGQLLGFDAAMMRDALAIATTEASGNTEYSCSGGTVKRTLGALGAYAGMRSALLAQAGITGSAQALEGKKSFVRGICTEEPSLDWFSLPFEGNWKTLDVGNKMYCCCAAQHTVIDAAEKIRARGIDPNDIAEIRILQLAREAGNVGQITDPQDVIQAQFCGRFACALRLVKGSNGFYDYNIDNINDPLIKSLVAKASYAADENREILVDGDGPARVTVAMNDGSEIAETVYYAVGTKQNPIDREGLVQKFKGLVSKAMPESKADQIVEAVFGLDELNDLTPLTSILTAEGK